MFPAGLKSIEYGREMCIFSFHARAAQMLPHLTRAAAVDSAKAEARKREGGSYLSADLSAVLTVLAQSAAAVASVKAEASAKTEALA